MAKKKTQEEKRQAVVEVQAGDAARALLLASPELAANLERCREADSKGRAERAKQDFHFVERFLELLD